MQAGVLAQSGAPCRGATEGRRRHTCDSRGAVAPLRPHKLPRWAGATLLHELDGQQAAFLRPCVLCSEPLDSQATLHERTARVLIHDSAACSASDARGCTVPARHRRCSGSSTQPRTASRPRTSRSSAWPSHSASAVTSAASSASAPAAPRAALSSVDGAASSAAAMHCGLRGRACRSMNAAAQFLPLSAFLGMRCCGHAQARHARCASPVANSSSALEPASTARWTQLEPAAVLARIELEAPVEPLRLERELTSQVLYDSFEVGHCGLLERCGGDRSASCCTDYHCPTAWVIRLRYALSCLQPRARNQAAKHSEARCRIHASTVQRSFTPRSFLRWTCVPCLTAPWRWCAHITQDEGRGRAGLQRPRRRTWTVQLAAAPPCRWQVKRWRQATHMLSASPIGQRARCVTHYLKHQAAVLRVAVAKTIGCIVYNVMERTRPLTAC